MPITMTPWNRILMCFLILDNLTFLGLTFLVGKQELELILSIAKQ